jgi:hypothetical protein
MRQTLTSIIVVSVLAGCGTNPSTDSPDHPPALVPAIDRFAIRPGVGLGQIMLGSTQEAVREAFGEPDRMNGPLAWEYLAHGFAVGFDKQGNLLAIFAGDGCLRGDPPAISPLVDAFKGRTATGLGMRSSRVKVEADLGPPDGEQKQEDFVSLTYEKLGVRLRFLKDELIYVTLVPPARK